MHKQVSMQLYCARNFPPLESQLATLADLGYTSVEPFGGLYGNVDALAAGLARHKLAAPSGHFSIDMLETDFSTAVANAKLLGMHLVIVPNLLAPLRPVDAAGWQQFGARLALLRRKLAAEGLAFAWHNHDFEMRALPGGSAPLDHILGADPELKWQADIGWIIRAGGDPFALFAKYGSQIAALHVKDIAAPHYPVVEDGWADVGHGTIDWAKVMAAAPKDALLVIEHDNPADFARFARRSLATVLGW